MSTALDIINQSLRLAGVLASGEVADSYMANESLVKLNPLIDSLSQENLLIYSETGSPITMDGAAGYSWGAGDFTDLQLTRPMRIKSAWCRDSNGIDTPVDIITADEYARIPDKTLVSDTVEKIWINPIAAYVQIYVWPIVNSGCDLWMLATLPLESFGTLLTAFNLPIGYERLLVYGLAAEIMIEYGNINPAIEQRFIDIKAGLKRTNTNPAVMRTSIPFGLGSGYVTLNRFRSGY
jgi:hypothetical protein